MGRSAAPVRRKILVVEDDVDIRASLEMVLSGDGYEIVTAADGCEALTYLHQASPLPDAIILDLRLPVMDGWRFRDVQRADPTIASIPVLAISADASPQAKAVHADLYLAKPFDMEALRSRVGELLIGVERREMKVRLEEAERLAAIGTLAAGVAHEINNPLTYVIGNLHLLSEQLGTLEDTADVAKGRASLGELTTLCESAANGAERIRLIVRNMRDLSRQDDDSRVPIDINSVLDASISMAAHQVKHRALLSRQYTAGPPVLGNEARLVQVFVNLIVNAAQSIAEGDAAHNRITVATSYTADRAVAEVRDTGEGIPAHVRARLFEPFFTTRPVGSGTGLGLSISRRIVVDHGGDIEVDSEVGVGSAFRVLLPLAAPARAPEVAPPAKAGPSQKRGRVLVVDDEEDLLFTIDRTLSQEHDLTLMTNARDVLARIDAGADFDVILCDLMMPDVTGMDLHAELARRSPALAAKIVFLTGGAFTERARRFLAEVPNQRVEKPFEIQALRALVRRFTS